MQQGNRRVSKTRIGVVYVCCFLGAAISPLESYLTTGGVDKGELSVAVLAFLVGSITATVVIVSLIKRGRFMQFRL